MSKVQQVNAWFLTWLENDCQLLIESQCIVLFRSSYAAIVPFQHDNFFEYM